MLCYVTLHYVIIRTQIVAFDLPKWSTDRL